MVTIPLGLIWPLVQLKKAESHARYLVHGYSSFIGVGVANKANVNAILIEQVFVRVLHQISTARMCQVTAVPRSVVGSKNPRSDLSINTLEILF